MIKKSIYLLAAALIAVSANAQSIKKVTGKPAGKPQAKQQMIQQPQAKQVATKVFGVGSAKNAKMAVAKRRADGEATTPVVAAEPDRLVLHAGWSLSGYSYSSNLAMTAAYAPMPFYNLTPEGDFSWLWSATEQQGEEGSLLTSTSRDFSFYVTKNYFTDIQLSGTYQNASETVWDFTVLPTQTIDGTGNMSSNLTDGVFVDDQGANWQQAYNNVELSDGSELMATETEAFAPTKGLIWSALAAKSVYYRNYPTEYGGIFLGINREAEFMLPAKAGQVIELEVATTKTGGATKSIYSEGVEETFLDTEGNVIGGVRIEFTDGYNYQTVALTAKEDNPYLRFESTFCIQKITVKAVDAAEPQTASFAWGKGWLKNSDGTDRYTASYLYAGGSAYDFYFSDETSSIMTRFNPDCGLAAYTNFATPDIATNSMSKIYCYHECPGSPLYITGVTLPIYNFTDNGNFNLHVKICKATRNGNSLEVGEVLAEGDATSENINSGGFLTGVEFTNLYMILEDGTMQDVYGLFLGEEFVIVIEGWDNGTFSGTLLSQSSPLTNGRISTWFELSGEEGSLRYYSTWNTSLFVGLLGATYGYLHTEDNTNLSMPAEGGQSVIHVDPMYYTVGDDGTLSARLFLFKAYENGQEVYDIPEWISVSFANEDYDKGKDYDLVLDVAALPEGMSYREASVTFYQEGANLTINIKQGEESAQTEYLKPQELEIMAGDTGRLSIHLNNERPIIMTEFTLHLPSGMTIGTTTDGAMDVALNGDRVDGSHSLSVVEKGNGFYHFLCYSAQNNAFAGNDGELISIGIKSETGMTKGYYTATLQDILMSDSDKNAIYQRNVGFSIKVNDGLLGDVNSDGQINVTDVVLIIDYILGRNPGNFNGAVADVNNDGSINVTDVVLVIDVILGRTTLNRAAALDEVGSIAITSLNEQATTIALNNPTAYTAFQMDVTLPQGVSLEKVQLTGRAALSHAVSASQQADGSYRIVGFSMANEPFTGNSGDLLTLSLQGDAQPEAPAIAVGNVQFVTASGIQHNLAGIEAYGEATGIDAIHNSQFTMDNYYNLNGQRVASPSKGIYVVNGKKMVVK